MSAAARIMLRVGSVEFTRLRLERYLQARGWVCVRSETAAQSSSYPPSLHQIPRAYGIGAPLPRSSTSASTSTSNASGLPLQTDCPHKHPNGWFLLCQDFLDQLATIEHDRTLDDDPIPRFAVDPAPARRVLVVEVVLAGRDFFGERLAEQVECCRPQSVLVSSVVDAAHAVFAGDQAGGREVFQWLLDSTLGVESDFGNEVGRVDQSIALSDRRHHGQAVFLAEYDPREFLNPLGSAVRHA